MLASIEIAAVAVCAISGALAAAGKRLDLFGVIVLAVVTAVGGGTIRDLCLGARPVFWIEDSRYVITATIAALATFVAARLWTLPYRGLLFADAFGLALFTIVGTEKSLVHKTSGEIAIVLGVVTGVAGGMLRDVLRREIPLVFQPATNLYATAAFAGAATLVALDRFNPGGQSHRYVAMLVVLALRLAAIFWRWRLPVFLARRPPSA